VVLKLVCKAIFSGNPQPAIGVRPFDGPVMRGASRALIGFRGSAELRQARRAQLQVSQGFKDDRTRMN